MTGDQGHLFRDIQRVEIKGLTYEQAFEKFHRLNPHVGQLLLRETLRIKRETGMETIGVDLILSRVRWLWAYRTKGDTFKINNNWKPYYARWLMEQEPELEGLFRLRARWARNKIMPTLNREQLER